MQKRAILNSSSLSQVYVSWTYDTDQAKAGYTQGYRIRLYDKNNSLVKTYYTSSKYISIPKADIPRMQKTYIDITPYYKNDTEDEREGFILTNDTEATKLRLFVNVECPSCIIHEIIHIKNIIFDIVCHNSNRYNDEPEAYLVQYLYDKIVEVYYKHKDNAKK